jgi:hypothetical protein
MKELQMRKSKKWYENKEMIEAIAKSIGVVLVWIIGINSTKYLVKTLFGKEISTWNAFQLGAIGNPIIIPAARSVKFLKKLGIM